ncbi:MAG: hypothetical protein ABSB94_08375 [Syntrophorhabdales bacterium]|jgi:hypothetical protein
MYLFYHAFGETFSVPFCQRLIVTPADEDDVAPFAAVCEPSGNDEQRIDGHGFSDAALQPPG